MNSENRFILHILVLDKFTEGYVEFMRTYMTKYENMFVLCGDITKYNITNMKNIYVIESYIELLRMGTMRRLLDGANKIILSGIFGDVEKYLFIYGNKIWKKTYMQFWGGDFYKYRREHQSIKRKTRKMLLRICINKCGGVINLIPYEYEELQKILGIKDVCHFVAGMPHNPKEEIDYEQYKIDPIDDGVCRILLGNSATVENQHEEIFRLLSRYKDENIEIYCPLSYGNQDYRDKIINLGNQVLGNKFHGVVDFMCKKEYVSFLHTCDIAIFNNNRQQAMGNISLMARMGKKIYIRDDTSMWKYFKSLGFIFYPVNELRTNSFVEFMSNDVEIRNRNKSIKRKTVEDYIQQWSHILDQ